MEERFALEILKELKASAKRWFIVSIVELIVIAVLIIIVLVVPVSETTTTTQEVADVDNKSTITQTMGGEE